MVELFAKKLKELRERSPYTQAQIAEKLGVKLRQYQRYEKDTFPPIVSIIHLSNLFEYDLLGHISKPNPSSSSEDLLPNKVLSQLLEGQEEVKAVLRRIESKISLGQPEAKDKPLDQVKADLLRKGRKADKDK